MDIFKQFKDQLKNVIQSDHIKKIIQSENIADQLTNIINPSPNKQIPNNMKPSNQFQLVYPPDPWDWKVVVSGMMPTQQFLFSDTIPMSDEIGAIYAPSSKSFYENYRTFLNFIKPTSVEIKKLLTEAQDKIKEPTYNPANGPTPDGWSKVNIRGITRWRPIWNVSESASDWVKKVKSGIINNPATITLEIPSNNDDTDTKNDLKQIEIKAKAWGQVSIYPDIWFNYSMIEIGKRYIEDSDMFFSENGSLNCRVSSFFVAYHPEYTLYTNSQSINKPINKGDFPDIVAVELEIF